MRNILAIAKREIANYFATPVGWLSMFGFLALSGFFYAIFTTVYVAESQAQAFNPYMGSQFNVDEHLVAPFWGNTSIILLFICPALTMRLFSEDRASGAAELLMTSPVSTLEIVLGKYFGALGFMLVILLATAHYPLLWFWLGDPDPGVMWSSYLSVFLVAASFMAIGMTFSAFTTNQVVALVLSFGTLLMLWVLGWVSTYSPDWLEPFMEFASLVNRMDAMSKGLVHSQDIVYYLTFIGFLLWVTYQRVESWRWS